jgi:nucleotide-binding universal stress UspA family protein
MYQKILIPLDGSELAECSLDHAKAIAQGCRVPEVILFRAMEPLPVRNLPPLAEARGVSIRSDIEREQQEAKDYVLKIENKLKAEGIPSQAITVEGEAAHEILNYAENNNVDLIIMCTHGRSGLSRFLFGSVAEKVSGHSRVPVLLISPEACRHPAP